jgi:isocitrate dehydrogenase (NAD+)
MKMVDGLFLDCCREASKKFPSIKYEEMIVDNACMQMTKTPQQFDVLVMPNLYGSIMTSIGAGLVGGAGLSPGAAFGSEFRLFEQATRKSGKKLAGKNEANPTALLFSGVNMLSCMGH